MMAVSQVFPAEQQPKLKVTGQGAPILLLHSSLSSHKQWLPLAALLSEQFSLWLPDLQGYGSNKAVAAGVTPEWSLAAEADAIMALLSPEQKNAELILIGHSYGGAVALHLARTQKLNVKAMVLFEPVAFHLLAAESSAEALALTAEVKALSQQIPTLEAWDAARLFVDYWQQKDYFRFLPVRMQQQMAAQVWKVPQDFAALIGEDATQADYARLQMPVLLMRGADSRRAALLVAELLAQSLTQVQTTTLPTGHMGPLTAPELVNQQIMDFLAGL